MDARRGLAAILRDARKGALLRMRSEISAQPEKMRLMDILSIRELVVRAAVDQAIRFRPETKMARRTAPFFRHEVAAVVCQPRLLSALSARRSIGSTITLVPTLTRE